MVLSVGRCGFGMIGKALSPLAPLCKGELLLQCEALPTIEGLLTEVSEKRKGCGRKAITPVVARIFSGDSTSPLTRDGHGCPKLNAQSFARMRNQQSVHMARGIVLFVGQHFSGSLFEWVHLSI